MRPVANVVLVAVLAAVGLVCLQPNADADDYATAPCPNGNGSGCAPDDKVHYWCYGPSLDGAQWIHLRNAIEWATNELAAATVMSSQQHQCDTTTDARFAAVDLGNETFGSYSCVTNASPRICARANLRLSEQTMEEAQRDAGADFSDGVVEPGELQWNRKKTACHELGHSVGFQHHWNDYYTDGGHPRDCMRRWWIEFEQDWLRYNAHHALHLDNWFP